MNATSNAPGLILGGGGSGNAAGPAGSSQLQTTYENLLSGAADIVSGLGIKTLVLTSGAIGTAGLIQIGNTETADEVRNNQAILKEIADFCATNGIKVQVQAVLTNGATYGTGANAINALVDQWATAAAVANLPISSVEDVQEIGISQPVSDFTGYAAIEVNAVQTLIKDYASSGYTLTASNLSLGDMEGGGASAVADITSWWDDINSAATSAGLQTLSSVTTDTGWFAPWIGNESVTTWQAALSMISTLAASRNMATDVTIQGTEADTSANQFLQQAEQNAISLAKFAATGSVHITNLEIQSWDPLPVGVGEISLPTSATNEAAEIDAVYPLYEAGLVTAQSPATLYAPGQFILNTETTMSLRALSVQWSTTDSADGSRLAVVLIDQSGLLSATSYGGGTVSNPAGNILVLCGDAADLAAELHSIMINEAVAGPDTVDVEVYASSGRLSDTQINILALPAGRSTGSIQSSCNRQGWISASALLNTGTVVSSGSVMTTETLHWNTSGTLVGSTGQVGFIKTDAIHEPLAEYGVEVASGKLLGTGVSAIADIFDPAVDDGAFPCDGYADNRGVNNLTLAPLSGWLPGSFNPATQVTPLIVQSTVNTFNPANGVLQKSVDIFTPDPITVVDFSGTHQDTFATAFNNGGSQVTEYNTGTNPEWQAGWQQQFSTATLTYDDAGQLVEEFLQGGAADPLFTVDYVFNPNNGHLWEEFQSTTPPPAAPGGQVYTGTSNPYQAGFASGPLYVTEFNDGSNPNWDYIDLGNGISSDTEVWTDYFIIENVAGFAVNSSAQCGTVNSYPYEFVNGASLDLMYLPGSIDVNLNALGTIVLNSQTLVSGLSGLTTVDAAGASGTVTLTGQSAGGSTLIGGDDVSKINAFGHDTIVVGAGLTTINTGAGHSAIQMVSANGTVSISGNGNTLQSIMGGTVTLTGSSDVLIGNDLHVKAGSAGNLTLSGDGDTVAVSAGATITATGTADILNYLNGGTCNQEGSGSSVILTGSGLTVWMSVNGGTVTATGNSNRITSGTNSTVRLTGNNNVVEAKEGTAVTIAGRGNIVDGANISVAAIGGLNTLSVVGDGDAITATNCTITADGDGDGLIGSNLRVATTSRTSTITVSGTNDVIQMLAGQTAYVSGIGDTVNGSNATIYAGANTSLTVKGTDDTIVLSGMAPAALANTSVSASGSHVLVMATAGQAGLAVYGGSGGVTLEVILGGTVSLNVADRNMTVRLDAASSVTVPSGYTNAITGSAGDDAFTLSAQALTSTTQINGGGGSNSLRLQGAGTFNLGASAQLSKIQTVTVSGALASQMQIIELRNGLDVAVAIQDAASVTIHGAKDTDTIALGAGTSWVYLGSASERVQGGSGADTYYVTASTIGAVISGGTGSNTLHVQGGGKATMGSSITHVQSAYLDDGASSCQFVANTTAGMTIVAGARADTITVGAGTQKVVGGAGNLRVLATSANAAVAVASGTGGATLEITTGGTVALNSTDTKLTVILDATTNLTLSKMAFITAVGSVTGHNTITAAGGYQTLQSIGGNDILVGSSGFNDIFSGNAFGLSGDTIRNFGGNDVIDVTDLNFAAVKPIAFTTATSILVASDGVHRVSIAVSNSFTAASFVTSADGHGGTDIKLSGH